MTDASFPQPVLLLGTQGMLWRAWTQWLTALNVEHFSPSLDQLDFMRPQTIAPAIPDRYRLVINCAAYTDVDGCEEHEALARQINATGVGHLARHCKSIDAPLVHYSTDYVFSGDATEPYPTDAPRSPVSAYGRTKAAGEQLIEQSGCDFLVVRTSWLYAPWAKNFVRTIAKLAAERDELKVVNDQRGRPTSAQHLAATTAKLLGKQARGVYHVTDGGECTWFDFACEIVRLTGAKCVVKPCTTDQFPRPAKRPAYSVLDLTKTQQTVGPMPPWEKNLEDVIERMEP